MKGVCGAQTVELNINKGPEPEKSCRSADALIGFPCARCCAWFGHKQTCSIKIKRPEGLHVRSGNCFFDYTGPISRALALCAVTRSGKSFEEYKSLLYLTSIRR